MTTAFRDALRDELVRAAERRNRQLVRRRRGLQAVVAVGVVLVAVTAFLRVDRPQSAAAGVDIEVRDGTITVTLTGIETQPDVIAAALADAGIDADVYAAPAGPSQLGRFVTYRADPSDLKPVRPEDGTFAGFEIPEGWEGHLELYLGRPARDGERYTRGANAFATGEPLACSGLLHTTVAEASRSDAVVGLEVTVHAYAENKFAGGASLADAAAARGSWLVVDALANSADAVVVSVTEDGSPVSGHDPAVAAPC